MKRIYSELEKQYSSKQTIQTNPTIETNITQNQSILQSNQSNTNQTNNNSYSINLLNRTANKTFQSYLSRNNKSTEKTKAYSPFNVMLKFIILIEKHQRKIEN